MINLYNIDCMDFMRQKTDKFYDLAIVDPPYGIGRHDTIGKGDKRQGSNPNKTWVLNDKWDIERPGPEYFAELFRVSKNQIIWGGNYFADLLPVGNKLIIWDKVQRVNQSDCEIAWTSFKGAHRLFQYDLNKTRGFKKNNPLGLRIHPTEKPRELYHYLLNNYAKPGFKILDTHGGSMTIAAACLDKGYDLDLTEVSQDIYNLAKHRFEIYKQKYYTAMNEPLNGETDWNMGLFKK